VFQDGSPVTAADVKFSLDRVLGPDALSSAAITMKPYLERTEIVDPATVKIYLTAASVLVSNWISEKNLIGKVVPQAYFQRVGKQGYQTNPMGAGPYKVKSIAPGTIALEAVPNHFNIG